MPAPTSIEFERAAVHQLLASNDFAISLSILFDWVGLPEYALAVLAAAEPVDDWVKSLDDGSGVSPEKAPELLVVLQGSMQKMLEAVTAANAKLAEVDGYMRLADAPKR